MAPAAQPRESAARLRVLRGAFAFAFLLWFGTAIAIAPETVRDLAGDDGDARDKAIATLVASRRSAGAAVARSLA